MHTWVVIATDAGDVGLLLPLTAAGVVLLWVVRSPMSAWWMLRSVAGAAAVIAALKLWFLSCGAHELPGVVSPSGHTCMSTAVYGCLAVVAGVGRRRSAQIAVGAAAALLVGGIAVSRVASGVHSVPEVGIGFAVGAAACAWFLRSFSRTVPRPLAPSLLIAVLGATALLAFGVRLPIESDLRHWARIIGKRCPGRAGTQRAPAPTSSPSSFPSHPAQHRQAPRH